jgi:pyruvate formate lyase activating enzyme
MIKERGKQIVLVTNGYINQEALEEIIENIDAFSLDIKGYFDQTAMAISGVKRYGQVLDNARLIYDRKKHLEITTNIIDGVNDSEDELQKIASFIAELSRDIPWHLSRSFPHFQMMDIEPTPLKTIEKAEDIAKRTGLRSIYRGNI